MQSNSSLWFHGTTPNYIQFQRFEYIKNLGWKLIIIPLDYHLDFPWHCFVPLALLLIALVFVNTKILCAIGVLSHDFFFIFLKGLSMVWSLGCNLLNGLLPVVQVFFSSPKNAKWSSDFSQTTPLTFKFFFTLLFHLCLREDCFGGCGNWSPMLSFCFSYNWRLVDMISICVGVVVGCGARLMLPTDGLMVLDLACTWHLSYKFEMDIEVCIGSA